MPDCGVHCLWFAFVCFLISPPPLKYIGQTRPWSTSPPERHSLKVYRHIEEDEEDWGTRATRHFICRSQRSNGFTARTRNGIAGLWPVSATEFAAGVTRNPNPFQRRHKGGHMIQGCRGTVFRMKCEAFTILSPGSCPSFPSTSLCPSRAILGHSSRVCFENGGCDIRKPRMAGLNAQGTLTALETGGRGVANRRRVKRRAKLHCRVL